MAMTKSYKMSTSSVLQFGIMVENAEKMTARSDRLENVVDALTSGGRTIVKKDDLVVTSLTVGKDHPFSFASVHHDLPLADSVERAPMVIEVVFKEGVADKLFVRVKTDLVHYCGVTATHTGFQVLEFMEHGTVDQVSPFPFTGINGAPDSHNSARRVLNFIRQISRILLSAVWSLLSPSYWAGRWSPGALQSSIEASCKGTRACRRYNQIPESVKYREILALTDAIKTRLKLRFYATTVNFSPSVAVAFVRTQADFQSREARLGGLTLPPFGAGPPPAMGSGAIASLFNGLFINNYGRWNPNFSGKVTDFMWDWMGIYTTFMTFTHIVQIQGKIFVRWCAHPEEWKKIEATGLLSKLGQGEAFTPVPFYSKAK